jgi:tRNA U34 2-thiouridine synthase MnmA/TrmU
MARGRLHLEVQRAEVKLRYRSPAVGADVVAEDGGFQLLLDAPAYGVAAGQAAVLYEGDAVVGAGTIMQDPVETLSGPRPLEPTGE